MSDGNSPPEPPVITKVRVYNRTPKLIIPDIPPLASSSSTGSPITPVSAASVQTPLRAARRSKWQKIDDVLETYGFDSLGDFLTTLFHNHPRGEPDPRTPRHRVAVTAFLQGTSTLAMANLISLIYNHPQSRPKRTNVSARATSFSPHKPLDNIRFAQPCLSAWATRLVGDEAYRRVGRLVKKKGNPNPRTHVRATTNGRKGNAEDKPEVANWTHMRFTIRQLIHQYSQEELLWYLTECFAAPRVKGKVVVRKHRPHPVVCASSPIMNIH